MICVLRAKPNYERVISTWCRELRRMNRLRGRQLQRRRELHRDANPWCVECLKLDQYTPWAELDHIVALVNGGTDTDDNLQGLCDAHHAAKTDRDMGRKTKGCDVDGNPADPSHHWRK